MKNTAPSGLSVSAAVGDVFAFSIPRLAMWGQMQVIDGFAYDAKEGVLDAKD